MSKIEFVLADYDHPQHAQDVIDLLAQYALSPTGGGEPLPDTTQQTLIAALQKFGHAFSVLGYVQSSAGEREPIALANCLLSFSTFTAKPIVNIHDVFVIAEMQGQGIAQQLLDFVALHAKDLGASKLTLEVLQGNEGARQAYRKNGFEAYTLGSEHGLAEFWQRYLD